MFPSLVFHEDDKIPEKNSVRITPARSKQDMAAIAGLFKAYAQSLGPVDLAFQSFDAELASLPGHYAPPTGELLLACDANDSPVGCVAVRPQKAPGHCELKRLYTVPSARGSGVGKRLLELAITFAQGMQYRHMRLDTLPSMVKAIAMYKKAGFIEAEAYYDTPIAETVFLSLELGSADQRPELEA